MESFPAKTESDLTDDHFDEITEAKQEAADQVVERVTSWDEGAQPEVADEHLREGFEEAGVRVDEAEVTRIAKDVHDREQPEIDDDAVS